MTPKTMRKAALSVLALGAASAAVVFGSWAAWTAQTTNPNNQVATGTLSLTSDKPGTFLFQASDVTPGDSGSETVTVENDGSIPLDLSLTQTAADDNGISAALGLRIHDGTNCVYPAAAGACVAWGAWEAAPLSALAQGSLAAGADRTYTVSWQLDSSSVNGDQGKTATFGLQWDGTPS